VDPVVNVAPVARFSPFSLTQEHREDENQQIEWR
jgi:hypothetical protein